MGAAGHRNPGIISQREVPVSSGRRLNRDSWFHQFIVEELSVEKVEDFVQVAAHSVVRGKLFHGDNSFQNSYWADRFIRDDGTEIDASFRWTVGGAGQMYMKKELPWMENPKQLLRLNMRFQKWKGEFTFSSTFFLGEEADVID